MHVNAPTHASQALANQALPTAKAPTAHDKTEVREKFDQFVGETLFSQMLKSMRQSVGKPAYFHGGQAEEVFQSQLDQKLAEEITKASAEKFSEPMFELFMARR
jgi:Rod binding domain-containing protein